MAERIVSGGLAGRAAVVAGVGGVIGAAVAERFAAEGATVVGLDRAQLDGGPREVLHVDLRDEPSDEGGGHPDIP